MTDYNERTYQLSWRVSTGFHSQYRTVVCSSARSESKKKKKKYNISFIKLHITFEGSGVTRETGGSGVIFH